VPKLSELYLTTGQAASRLGVNRLTIQRWVKSGRLPGEVVGYVTLILRADIERLANERASNNE